MDNSQFKQHVRKFNDGFDMEAAGLLWSYNTEHNLPRIKKKNSYHLLTGLFQGEKEKAVILVGASPALKRDIDKLKGINRDRFCIIACNSALRFMLEHDVKPDYVIAIDGDKANIVDHLTCDNEDIKLIVSTAVAPEIFDVWKGKEIWWTPWYANLREDLKRKVRYRLGRKLPSGGNSITLAMSICTFIFRSRMIIFVGNEFCYDERYYVDKDSEWEKPDKVHFPVHDINGNKRYTNMPLYQYNVFIEQVADHMHDIVYIDTSFGLLGVDSKRVHSLELNEAIQKVNAAFDKKTEKVDWRECERIKYNAAYATGHYVARMGERFWKSILPQIDLGDIKTSLDIGTGIGAPVVMLRNRGIDAYGVDIADGAIPYWEKAKIDKFCKVACADQLPFPDNHFDFVTSTEVYEHLPEHAILGALKEAFRVGKSDFLFTIAIQRAHVLFPHDNSQPHLTVKSPDWWEDIFAKVGFHSFIITLAEQQQSILVLAQKHEDCHLQIIHEHGYLAPIKGAQIIFKMIPGVSDVAKTN